MNLQPAAPKDPVAGAEHHERHPLREGSADGEQHVGPRAFVVPTIRAMADGTLFLFPANPSTPCHSLFRDVRRRTPRPRRVGRRATCQLTSLSEARRPETRAQCVCVRLAGEVIKHDASDETLKALFSFALERWKRQFPDRTFGIFVWCAMRGLDVCRPAESPFLAGQTKSSSYRRSNSCTCLRATISSLTASR